MTKEKKVFIVLGAISIVIILVACKGLATYLAKPNTLMWQVLNASQIAFWVSLFLAVLWLLIGWLESLMSSITSTWEDIIYYGVGIIDGLVLVIAVLILFAGGVISFF